MAKSLEGILHQRTDINHSIEEAQSRKDRKYTVWFWIGICLIAASAASVVAFYMAMIGYAALYGAAAGIVLGAVALMVNSHIVNKKHISCRSIMMSWPILKRSGKTLHPISPARFLNP